MWCVVQRLVAVLLMLLVLPAAGQAQTSPAEALTAALQRLATENFNDIEAGVTALAQSGSPRALAIVEALADSRLIYRTADRAVFIRGADGSFAAAATGEAVTPAPTGTRPVRLNNRVRRAIESAVGALTLFSPDPARRREAAEAVFKSRSPAALETLTAAAARETDPAIRRALNDARAAIIVHNAEAPEADRIAAIALLAARSDQDAIGVLRALPATTPAPVLRAAADAIAAIENHLAILQAVQNAWFGLSLGSVLLLAAIGLAITFGVMGVINMAHGEMVMIGAYVTFVVQEVFRAAAPHLFDLSLAVALPLAFLTAGLVGVLIERGVIRFLYGRPLETLLATWGISLMLQQAVRSIFGANNREVGNPSFMSGSFEVFGIALTWNRLWIVVFAMVVFFTLLFVLHKTSFGLRMRAVVQNRRMAASMGIRTPWVDAMTFGLGSGIAGIAGVALSQIDNVSPNLGQSYIIDSFLVVVFGGVGSLWGTLVAALSIGVANKLLEPVVGAVLGKILLLVAVILFIQKRPRGLFALKGRAVEP